MITALLTTSIAAMAFSDDKVLVADRDVKGRGHHPQTRRIQRRRLLPGVRRVRHQQALQRHQKAVLPLSTGRVPGLPVHHILQPPHVRAEQNHEKPRVSGDRNPVRATAGAGRQIQKNRIRNLVHRVPELPPVRAVGIRPKHVAFPCQQSHHQQCSRSVHCTVQRAGPHACCVRPVLHRNRRRPEGCNKTGRQPQRPPPLAAGVG